MGIRRECMWTLYGYRSRASAGARAGAGAGALGWGWGFFRGFPVAAGVFSWATLWFNSILLTVLFTTLLGLALALADIGAR